MRVGVRDSGLASLVVTTALLLTACGRSAPEGAIPETGGDAQTEPVAAGVQVVSENPVVATVSTAAPVITTASTPPSESSTHEVQPGDTLSALAERYGVTIEAISAANGITDVNSIRPGQELIIPAAG